MPDAIHRDPEDDKPWVGRPRRRSPQGVPRPKSIRVSLSDAEHAEVSAAAARAGLAQGAFAAEATLAAARGMMITPDAVLRDLLSRFDRAIMQVRRIGVNLNQAVAALNATGQPGGDLVPYAALSVRGAARLEAVADELRTRIVSAIRSRGPARFPAGPPSGSRCAGPDWCGSGPGFPVR
jgi:hypothetical protein